MIREVIHYLLSPLDSMAVEVGEGVDMEGEEHSEENNTSIEEHETVLVESEEGTVTVIVQPQTG